MITILLTYADGDQAYTRFNGSEQDAVRFYRENNFFAKAANIKIQSLFFPKSNRTVVLQKESATATANSRDAQNNEIT